MRNDVVYLGGRFSPSLFHARPAPWMHSKELFAFSLPSAPVSPARSRQPAVLLPAASLMYSTVRVTCQSVAAWMPTWPHWFVHNAPPCFLAEEKHSVFYRMLSQKCYWGDSLCVSAGALPGPIQQPDCDTWPPYHVKRRSITTASAVWVPRRAP